MMLPFVEHVVTWKKILLPGFGLCLHSNISSKSFRFLSTFELNLKHFFPSSIFCNSVSLYFENNISVWDRPEIANIVERAKNDMNKQKTMSLLRNKMGKHILDFFTHFLNILRKIALRYWVQLLFRRLLFIENLGLIDFKNLHSFNRSERTTMRSWANDLF